MQLIFLDAKGSFGLRELNIGFTQSLIAPVGDVRVQQISAFGHLRLVVKLNVVLDV